jgi:hypothetical protein
MTQDDRNISDSSFVLSALCNNEKEIDLRKQRMCIFGNIGKRRFVYNALKRMWVPSLKRGRICLLLVVVPLSGVVIQRIKLI